MHNEKTENKSEDVKAWADKIDSAKKKHEDYHRIVKETREYYKNEKNKGKQNIFWSSIETLKPFLYFKQPKPYIDIWNKDAGVEAKLACKILEKALEWNLAQFDFDSVIKYARNDFLISGMGVIQIKYKPEIKQIDEKTKVKMGEKVVAEYIDPCNFIADCNEVGIWEEVEWFAISVPMSKQEVIDQFGEDTARLIIDEKAKDIEQDKRKATKVYVIWDKKTKKVYYYCPECKTEFLKEDNDPLNLEGFFSIPKPIYATLTNDSIIPIPDYSLIKVQLDELDGITSRMRLIMQALKVSGAFDNAFPELANILQKDVTLVSISDFVKLKDAGGIKGIIEFVPIEQYIVALRALAERRQDIISQIYEITGVSDIMRGNSDPNETATAITKKTNFGTLRNQDRQNDMQRFICDLLKIMAEIICEQFSDEKLLGFLSDGEKQKVELVQKAIAVLRNDKLRNMVLGIETDTSFSQDGMGQKTTEAVTIINEMIGSAFNVVSQQPLLLPLYKMMISSVAATLPNTRQFAAELDNCFDKIAQELAQPKQEEPKQNPRIEVDMQKNQQVYEVNKEKNQLKAKELDDKNTQAQAKLLLQKEEAEMQMILKQEQLAQGNNVSANISYGGVGQVRSF